MQFVGVDLHTNKFTCCYRDDRKEKKETVTFELTELGLADFYRTLTIANTYELKQISLARKNTDKIDADILCRVLKMQILSGEQTISPVVIPPV
jgi:hypothetical protein